MYKRQAYSEAFFRQDTELFLRGVENAWRAFGGVAKTLNLDNLKAGVLKCDWADPELNPKPVFNSDFLDQTSFQQVMKTRFGVGTTFSRVVRRGFSHGRR